MESREVGKKWESETEKPVRYSQMFEPYPEGISEPLKSCRQQSDVI